MPTLKAAKRPRSRRPKNAKKKKPWRRKSENDSKH
jgi:hypothetical protein